MMDLSTLNPEQRIAAQTTEGPLLILAGAGSGKTRALTYRIANLISKGVPAWHILAITFTNKAAREMRERIDKLAGAEAQDAWISTFHACCARILRRDIEKLGYERVFSIYDDDDQISVIKDLLKGMNLDDKTFSPREIKSAISDAKNKMQTPEAWFEASEGDFRAQRIRELYTEYEKRLKQNNALDFDDLLVKTLELFVTHPPVLASYQERFHYIHVDEYQDTNYAQYMLVKLLAGERRNLCVVGDDDQSIYGWRGADIRNILEFEKDFPDTKVIKLERNYRSTANILDAANQVIAHNVGRKEKALWTEQDAGDKIVLFCSGDEREEAAWVCDRMQQLCQSGIPYGHMAALYRTNAQTRVMEEMLVRAGIPYRMYGGTRFYDRKEIKDIVAYLRVLVNPADDVSLRRIINTPRRSIGDATISELARCAAENGYSLFTTMLEPHETLASRARKSVSDFGVALTRMMALRETMSLGDFVAQLIEEFELSKQYERDNTEESKDRIQNIDEFIGAAREFAQKVDNPTLENFLENIALVSDLDGMVDGSQAVTLMTLHSAKGLEFDHVFMIGMEQGLFPSYRSQQDEDRLEEERRLCYVGITRAKKQLFLSHTTQRLLYNQMQHNEISQFVNEIPRRLVEDLSVARQAPLVNPAVRTREQIQAARSTHTTARDFAGGRSGALKIPGVQKGFSPSVARAFAEQTAAVLLFKPGDRVLHKKFGEGNVIELRGEGSEGRVVIEFAAYGVREFVASLAPIVKVGE